MTLGASFSRYRLIAGTTRLSSYEKATVRTYALLCDVRTDIVHAAMHSDGMCGTEIGYGATACA
eukprot:1481400-Rhodomonas_salina.1